VAANNVTNWSGTCYITPLIGAFLADAYLGRFWTIASFMVIYIIVSSSIHPPAIDIFIVGITMGMLDQTPDVHY
jgi:dipeptide/tripeptide permease